MAGSPACAASGRSPSGSGRAASGQQPVLAEPGHALGPRGCPPSGQQPVRPEPGDAAPAARSRWRSSGCSGRSRRRSWWAPSGCRRPEWSCPVRRVRVARAPVPRVPVVRARTPALMPNQTSVPRPGERPARGGGRPGVPVAAVASVLAAVAVDSRPRRRSSGGPGGRGSAQGCVRSRWRTSGPWPQVQAREASGIRADAGAVDRRREPSPR